MPLNKPKRLGYNITMRDKDDKTADERHGSICDDCDKLAIAWVHDDNGDERLVCQKHLKPYKDWRIEQV